MRLGERAETCLQRCSRAAGQQERCKKRGSWCLSIVTLNLLTYQMGINLIPWGGVIVRLKSSKRGLRILESEGLWRPRALYRAVTEPGARSLGEGVRSIPVFTSKCDLSKWRFGAPAVTTSWHLRLTLIEPCQCARTIVRASPSSLFPQADLGLGEAR